MSYCTNHLNFQFYSFMMTFNHLFVFWFMHMLHVKIDLGIACSWLPLYVHVVIVRIYSSSQIISIWFKDAINNRYTQVIVILYWKKLKGSDRIYFIIFNLSRWSEHHTIIFLFNVRMHLTSPFYIFFLLRFVDICNDFKEWLN